MKTARLVSVLCMFRIFTQARPVLDLGTFTYNGPLPWIQRSGSKLVSVSPDGRSEEFRFISFNTPNLQAIEDLEPGKWVHPQPKEQKDALLTIAALGGRVTRTYVLSMDKFHITAPYTYKEDGFVALDHAISNAAKAGVHLILPLINNTPDHELPGSYSLFTSFLGLKKEEFYTNKEVMSMVKHFIAHVILRVNTVTGIPYKDDPTIMCWHIGNELGSWNDPTPPTSWTLEIAGFIKSMDPNHLIMDGTLAGHHQNRWSLEALKSPLVDIFYNNYYWGESDVTSNRIRDHARYIHSFNKPFIICEFGLANVNVYKDVLKETIKHGISGALIWSLRFHSRRGGFYVHTEHTGHRSFHAPGFPHQNGFNDKDEEAVMQLFKKYAYRIQGKEVPQVIPNSPVAFVEDGKLKWFGSVMASSYNVFRSEDGKDWTLVASGLSDAAPSGSVSWVDRHRPGNRQFFYKLTAHHESYSSGYSNVVSM